MKISITYELEEEEKVRIIWSFLRAYARDAFLYLKEINPHSEGQNDAL